MNIVEDQNYFLLTALSQLQYKFLICCSIDHLVMYTEKNV